MNPVTPDLAVVPALPGLGFLGTMVESARQTLLLLLRNRFLWFVLAAELVLGVLAFGLTGVAHERLDGSELFCLFAWWFLAGVVLPWTTFYLAVQTVHGEIEDRTFQYLFLRPVGRSGIVLGKWLAVVLIAGVVGMFGGAVLFLGVAARPEMWANGVDLRFASAFALVLGVGGVAYAAVGVWIAAVFRRPLVWSAVVLLLQTVIALLPVSAGIRMLTVSDPLRRLVLDRLEPGSRLAQMLWPTERDFRSELVGQPLLSLAVLTLVMLVLCVVSYCRSEYDSRTRE